VIVPADGAVGTGGCGMITTFSDGGDMHPVELVTVKVKVPVGIVEIVTLVPLPVLVTAPGILVNVHDPVDGNPLKTTLPVDIAHVGCVMVPITGAVGDDGWGLITALAEDTDVQPAALVTVKL
jgi:hypothetical protein